MGIKGSDIVVHVIHILVVADHFYLQSVRFHAKFWLPARSIVMECLAAGFDVDPSGELCS